MNTKAENLQYNISAVSTVARYAGLALADVLAILDRRKPRHRIPKYEAQSSIDLKHRRAIVTVAKYAGIILTASLQAPEYGMQKPGAGHENHDKAA